MFRSKRRNIVVPQSEHARLAGTLAYFWGNENFDKPAFNFESFVEGVAFHDWAYGMNDNLSLGEISDDQWIGIVEKGAKLKFENPVVEIVAKLHIKRLISGVNFPSKNKIINLIDDDINLRIKFTKHPLKDFLWSDRITDFCDMLAFDFSFEKITERKLYIYSKKGSEIQEEISYRISEKGIVEVNPWPFSVQEISGFIFSYKSESYPDKLISNIMQYSIINKNT